MEMTISTWIDWFLSRSCLFCLCSLPVPWYLQETVEVSRRGKYTSQWLRVMCWLFWCHQTLLMSTKFILFPSECLLFLFSLCSWQLIIAGPSICCQWGWHGTHGWLRHGSCGETGIHGDKCWNHCISRGWCEISRRLCLVLLIPSLLIPRLSLICPSPPDLCPAWVARWQGVSPVGYVLVLGVSWEVMSQSYTEAVGDETLSACVSGCCNLLPSERPASVPRPTKAQVKVEPGRV